MPVTDELMERGETALQHQLRGLPWLPPRPATASPSNMASPRWSRLQDERIRKMADGEIFNTITNGKNTMMAYGPNVTVTRSLGDHCLSARVATQPKRHGADVPPEHRAELDKPADNQPNPKRRRKK